MPLNSLTLSRNEIDTTRPRTVARRNKYGQFDIGGPIGAGDIKNAMAQDRQVQMAADVAQDMMPVVESVRSIERLPAQWQAYQDAESPIQKALRAAEMALEGGALVSDVIPYVKAAGAVGGTLIPLMMRRNDELDAMAKFGFRQRGLIGYHGSPHKFSKFDHSMMGSGEGAQAYGWGTYLAERRGVARTYINPEGSYKRLSGHLPPKTEMAYDFLENGYSDSDTLFKMQEYYGDNADFDEIWGAIQDAQKQGAGTGNLYEVDLPDEQIAKMLDWDAPLPDTPEVRKLWNQVYDEPFDPGTVDGARFYSDLTEEMLSQEGASKALNQAGIPGIKYWDGGSRQAPYLVQPMYKGKPYGERIPAVKNQVKMLVDDYKAKGFDVKVDEGTRNYVVFDENIMTILKRNDEPI